MYTKQQLENEYGYEFNSDYCVVVDISGYVLAAESLASGLVPI